MKKILLSLTILGSALFADSIVIKNDIAEITKFSEKIVFKMKDIISVKSKSSFKYTINLETKNGNLYNIEFDNNNIYYKLIDEMRNIESKK